MSVINSFRIVLSHFFIRCFITVQYKIFEIIKTILIKILNDYSQHLSLFQGITSTSDLLIKGKIPTTINDDAIIKNQ